MNETNKRASLNNQAFQNKTKLSNGHYIFNSLLDSSVSCKIQTKTTSITHREKEKESKRSEMSRTVEMAEAGERGGWGNDGSGRGGGGGSGGGGGGGG